ncbi:MAG: multicopper oxidase domain-containing protein [Actinomycetota bacterium]
MRRPSARRLLAGVVVLAAIGAGVGYAVYRAVSFQDPAVRVSGPAENPLWVPSLATPAIADDGTVRYDIELAPSTHDFGDGRVSPTLAYGGGSLLGPTLRLGEGASAQLAVTNRTGEITTTHWHGADVPGDDDGGPHSPIAPGETWIADFDVVQSAATLWYHPHRMGTTAEQVYAGAAGFLLIDDASVASEVLPREYGVNDIPLLLQDRDFDENGELAYELVAAGRGDQDPYLFVNGTSNPYLDVPAGLIRLRLLNGSQGRVYDIAVDGAALTMVASDGGYLATPAVLDDLELAPGERAEIVVDVPEDGVVSITDDAFGRVIELRADPDLGRSAGSLPERLATIEPLDLDGAVERSFHLEEVGDGWGINGRQMDMGRVDLDIAHGDTEVWTLTARNGIHAFHVHQVQFQVVTRNGAPPPPEESGWKDTVRVTGSDTVVIAARFDSFTSEVPYMFHCHLLDHEDLGMMGQFTVSAAAS